MVWVFIPHSWRWRWMRSPSSMRTRSDPKVRRMGRIRRWPWVVVAILLFVRVPWMSRMAARALRGCRSSCGSLGQYCARWALDVAFLLLDKIFVFLLCFWIEELVLLVWGHVWMRIVGVVECGLLELHLSKGGFFSDWIHVGCYYKVKMVMILTLEIVSSLEKQQSWWKRPIPICALS